MSGINSFKAKYKNVKFNIKIKKYCTNQIKKCKMGVVYNYEVSKMKLKTRMYALIVPMILVICILYTLELIVGLVSNSNAEATESIKNNLHMLNYTLDNMYPGEYQKVESMIYKGDSRIDWAKALAVVDTGTTYEYSVFVGDRRMATTIESAQNLVGDKADDDIIEQVIKGSKSVRQNIEIGGEPFYAQYDPIIDAKGEVIGMLFVGQNRTHSIQTMTKILISSFIATGILIVIAVIIVGVVVERISKRISKLSKAVDLLKDKDFTQDIGSENYKGSDELSKMGRKVINMQEDLGETIYHINTLTGEVNGEASALSVVSEEISKAIESVASTMEQIAQGANDQAEDIISINEAVKDLGESVVKVGHAIQGIDQETKDISQVADENQKQMNDVIEVVKGVTNVFSEYEMRMDNFEKSMSKIDEIIVTISSISEQTNLLALNAAIEAARAGDAGKGFTVVANEIRNLAEESRSSTQDIEKIISSVSEEAKELGESTKMMSTELKNEGESLVQMVSSFEKILVAINNIVPHINAVNGESKLLNKQKNSILGKIENTSAIAEEVSAACQEISANTEEMNASTREIAEAASKLDQMTSRLEERTNIFKIKSHYE